MTMSLGGFAEIDPADGVILPTTAPFPEPTGVSGRSSGCHIPKTMTPPTYDPDLLERVFGAGESTTPNDRARSSLRRFVRGLDLLTFDDSPKAKGRRLTASEALEAYGYDKLAEVATDGSALISESDDAAGRALSERRQKLGLQIRHVAAETQLPRAVIEALEASGRRPIREYEKVARVLGLDERMLSYRSDPGGNEGVAVRLRTLHDDRPALTGDVVLAIAEAAWVAMTQIRLEAALQLAPSRHVFEPEPSYGGPGHPAYKVGYDLADAFRAKLDLGDGPIASMRDTVERELRIPVVQAALGARIAGATIESGGRRAIVVNLSGRNQNVFVRRCTLSHELCHLLFDPQQRLRDLRVDEYEDLDKRADQVTDAVEQRANAFGVQLLLPQSAALPMYQADPGGALAKAIDSFGISFMAARYQIWNALGRTVPIESLMADSAAPQPDWEGREAYTTVYHPIRALADHPSRAGRFSAVVLRAAEAGVISWDTAGEWLYSSEEELGGHAAAIRGLYPDLFR
jgi:Zn-dependent peptidase ImmA (M78 family)